MSHCLLIEDLRREQYQLLVVIHLEATCFQDTHGSIGKKKTLHDCGKCHDLVGW